MIVIVAAMAAGAISGMWIMATASKGPLSPVLPEDGRGATVVGGLAAGGLAGILVPVILLSVVKPDSRGDRATPSQAAWRLIGVGMITAYLAVISLIVAQLGWILPMTATIAIAIPLIGLSWIPAGILTTSDRFQDSRLGRLLPKSRQ
ncbi:hypothetical protein [Streptomyces sp. NPDC051776]|uniref:hypothetical protein n=1 Tax=Streptomyces sp. NPDC051776 TaxID=3155414 RepID=UPI003438E28D